VFDSESRNIPRIIHQIWLGGDVPGNLRALMQTWRELHPEWKYMLWTESNLPELVNQSQFDGAGLFAVKADIARVEILREFGGVYVDADYECHRPIDPLVEGANLMVLSEGDGSITNSIIGSIPDHELLSVLIDEMGQIDLDAISSPDFDPLTWTGPKLWTRVISRQGLVFSNGFRLLPPDFFVLPKTRVPELRELSGLRRYGTHHALATWRNERGIGNLVRRSRLRTRLRRFFDLSAS
jgi:inositol phosphorylceramide mannosyltransferase catalytic subunit